MYSGQETQDRNLRVLARILYSAKSLEKGKKRGGRRLTAYFKSLVSDFLFGMEIGRAASALDVSS